MSTRTVPIAIAICLGVCTSAAVAEPLPDAVRAFITAYCLDCHNADSNEGGLNLESPAVAWADRDSIDQWTRVFDMLDDEAMPPADADQPASEERQAMLKWLHGTLSKHDRPEGTVLRRLNRIEYENSVRAALGIPFTAPRGFPADPESHGFDNIGEGLVLSPPLMQKYFEIAGQAADLVIPPARDSIQVRPETVELGPEDFSMNFTGSEFQAKSMRLVTQTGVVIRSCTWPTRFEAQYTGTYSFKTRLSAFKPHSNDPLHVELLVVPPSVTFTKVPPLKRAARFKVPADGKTHELSAEFDLEKGQTVAFYWSNAPIGIDADTHIREAFVENPRLHAAWIRIGRFDRSRTAKQTWQALKSAMAADDLDLSAPEIKNPPTKYRVLDRNQLNWALESMHMELGPALDIHSATFTGPTELKESRDDVAQRLRTARFLGEPGGRGNTEYARAVLRPFLERAFRRPIADAQSAEYVNIALRHIDDGHRFEDGIHLAIRAALCSPHFLYRGHRDGRLDDHDLASRLSYFLTSSPPDVSLRKLADAGKLSDPKSLETATRRLLKDNRSRYFLESFTDQWLDLNALPDIMPDERLIKWTPKHLQAITAETRLVVEEILRENHPVETFIDPDFTFLNRRNADLYGMKISGDEMQRVSIKRGGRHGGILGQASVMMATANGVDTQPVLRGVWLLENVFGQHPPAPPASVPAIEPDTSGAKSIRELLTRHKADSSCAGCHRKIDPLGFALENFDPVGRWREFYPVYRKQADGKVVTKKGQPVDSAGELSDGTPLRDIVDLKRYLVTNIDVFSACLTGKLLTYATGRPPSFGDRQEIERIVRDVAKNGNGFQDLIVAVVLSESFRNK